MYLASSSSSCYYTLLLFLLLFNLLILLLLPLILILLLLLLLPLPYLLLLLPLLQVDLALGGGLSRGTLSEVVGPAGAGKTQLCLSVAAMAGVPESLGGLGEGRLGLDEGIEVVGIVCLLVCL
jgi:hypothetical protein